MNRIHPSAIIGDNVVLGSGNSIGAFVVIAGDTVIGDDNWIGSGAKLGVPAEMRSVKHDGDWLDQSGPGLAVGNRNVIREDAQVHGGWRQRTVLGNDLFIMNRSYVAHDCVLADGVTLASGVALGGHVRVGASANLGLGTTVHQGRTIGGLAMVGMSSVITRDIPPFVKAFGSPCRAMGVNTVGLERAGFSIHTIQKIVELAESPDFPRSLLSLPDTHIFVQQYLTSVLE